MGSRKGRMNGKEGRSDVMVKDKRVGHDGEG
jgi:hypothetical protein